MTTTEAARRIGVSVQQVRWMIRHDKLDARKVKVKTNQHGHVYDIPEKEVERVRAEPQTTGRPRGKRRRKARSKKTYGGG